MTKAGKQVLRPMKNVLRRLCAWYVHFAEKQGFPIIVTVCVGVIAATALWTGRQEIPPASPTPPVGQSISAAQLLQQSLRDAATPTPAPTEAPQTWHPPVENSAVIRTSSAEVFYQGSETGIWQIHDAVDLACAPGTKICAMADGIVLGCGQDDLLGGWVTIDHGEGLEALYAGMALCGPHLPGDTLKAGAIIGYAGQGPLEEQDLPPHLHLRLTLEGVAIDPTTLWE